jgi:pimeloyl-ACP methyl ester carboxylesterase
VVVPPVTALRLLILIALISLAGPVSRAQDYPLPSRRVDIGGYKLYIHCLGEGHPTVVLDHGLGSSSGDWKQVQAGVSRFTQACRYDRGGYGQSDWGPAPRTSSRLAAELRTLLARAEIPPPYILAGHSFGGYNMRLFASFYPHDVAGLMLVDSPNEDQITGFFQSRIVRQIDPTGTLAQLWRPDILSALSTLDPIAALLGFEFPTLRAILDELAGFKESGEELRAAVAHFDIPLVVIHHDRPLLPAGPFDIPIDQEWEALQRKLASRYKRHTFIVAKGSSHNITREQPALIIEAIRRLFKSL